MRVLFLCSRPPWPSRRGDQARVAGLVSELAGRHEVSVLAERPPSFPEAAPPEGVHGRSVGRSPLSLLLAPFALPRMPAQTALYVDRGFLAAVRAEIARFRPHVVVVVLSRLGWLLPHLRGVPVVLDLIDALSLNMRNRAEREGWSKPFWRWEGARMARWEGRLVERAAAATVVSERDRRALLASMAGRGEKAVQVVPFGVPLPEAAGREEERRKVVLLSGNLGYFPTHEGALWFAREVWPRVRAARPDAGWWLAGARPGRELAALAEMPGVRVIADPPDLREIRRQASVAIAPLRCGSGTPIKILEAMADGIPVVATPEGAEGLDELAGGELLTAAGAGAFAVEVLELLERPERAREQARRARAWLERRHELGRTAVAFDRVLEAVALRP